MKILFLRLVAFALVCVSFLAVQPIAAQPADDTQAKQVIIFGRHGVRTPVLPNSVLDAFSVQPYPVFPGVPAGRAGIAVITPNGVTDETILGSYFHLWLKQEGLLTGNDSADANLVYFRANDTPLILGTAQAFWSGMLPAAGPPNVNVVSPGSDPLFDPVDAGVALLDYQKAVAAVNGRLGSNPSALATAYAPELALTRSVLLGYPFNDAAAPPAPANVTDVTNFTANPITATAGSSSVPVNLGGLEQVIYAIDPFVMEYTDGLPMAQVGWGQLTSGNIGQIFRLYDLLLNLEYRTPYLDQVQSSNVASHIVRSLVQAATGNQMSGALATPSSKVVVLIASNTNISGLAGLFQLDWLLPSYQPDVSAPSGVLMFELRQSQTTGEYIVRTSYVAQTMDQLRNLTPLTLDAPPASAPVFIPGCSAGNATFDCPLGKFVSIANQVIDPHSADLVN
ncbi:MAG: histidine-type phosphatase [Bryobacteraceae bacterium]